MPTLHIPNQNSIKSAHPHNTYTHVHTCTSDTAQHSSLKFSVSSVDSASSTVHCQYPHLVLGAGHTGNQKKEEECFTKMQEWTYPEREEFINYSSRSAMFAWQLLPVYMHLLNMYSHTILELQSDNYSQSLLKIGFVPRQNFYYNLWWLTYIQLIDGLRLMVAMAMDLHDHIATSQTPTCWCPTECTSCPTEWTAREIYMQWSAFQHNHLTDIRGSNVNCIHRAILAGYKCCLTGLMTNMTG